MEMRGPALTAMRRQQIHQHGVVEGNWHNSMLELAIRSTCAELKPSSTFGDLFGNSQPM